MKDIFGTAILDYQLGDYSENLVTSTSISEADSLPLPYLFRSYSEMPSLEQTALKLSNGTVLDIGCGAGSHSLYLKSKGLDVKSIDISAGAIEACRLRGLDKAYVLDVMEETDSFDTMLLLMNGSGIFQSLYHTPYVLRHLKTLLNPGGQILIDSSDIKYMYEDDDGGYWIDTTKDYYGELDYSVRYKKQEATFRWMYLDFENLKIACKQAGFLCKLIEEGPHFDYLAKITMA